MRVALFFVCLCFLLVKKDSHVYAGTQQDNSCYELARYIGEARQGYTVNQYCFVTAAPDSADKELAYLISDDVEDEDSNDFSATKDRLPARCYYPVYSYPSYPAILNYRCNCFKAPPFFFGQVSDKCILLRVLRI